MAKLDFSALNKIAYRGFETAEEREKKDALIEQGFTVVEGEDLPFEEPQTSTIAPLKVEVKQIFSLQAMEPLCNLYKAGKIELLDKLRIFKGSGAVYAHFMLDLTARSETASEPSTASAASKP